MTEVSARPGFALVLAILAVVVASALVVATHVAVGLEHTTAVTAVTRQRAFAASEYALWGAVADWDGANAGLQPGGANIRVIRAGGDSAVLTTFRLDEEMYWLVADAIVGETRRRTGLNVLAVTDSTGTHIRQVRRSWVELH